MSIAKGIVASLLATVIACAAPDLLAQFPGGGGMPKGGGSMRGAERPPRDAVRSDQRSAAQESTVELVEFRLLMLEEDLKLSPSQQKTWDPYADQVRALATDVSRERGRVQAGAQLTALQQINRAVDTARNRLTALEEIAAAAKTLYDGLSPEQKMLADSRFATIIPIITGGAPAGMPNERLVKPRPTQEGSFGRPGRDR